MTKDTDFDAGRLGEPAASLYRALADIASLHAVENEDDIDHFERIADRFHRETGYLRPGKSVPLELHTDDYEERRQKAWREWSNGFRERMFSALTAARAHPAPADAGAGEGVEYLAKHFLAQVRSDTAASGTLPCDEKRECLLTDSIQARVREALHKALTTPSDAGQDRKEPDA